MELTQEQINDIVTAVFSLMESQGMLPESQLDVLAQNVKRRLQLDSVGVDEVPLVDSIEGINSLPCVRQSGSVFDVVRTPLELLKGKLAALPVFRISSGYWQVSEDNGNTWKDITDSLGNRVSAQGEKGEQGNQGDPGQTGEKGDPGDKGDNGENVYLQSNGTELQWKMGEDGEWQTLILLSEIKGAASMGELTNVSQEADIAEDGSVLMYRDNEWKPAAECFIPTGTAEDGSIITTFSDLMNYISTHGEGGGGTGVQRNIRITNNLESKNISASKGEPCLLDFTFISQERYSSNEPYEDTGERGMCQISVKNNINSEYVIVKQLYINSSVPFKTDIAEFLTSGANNVMIKVTGEVTEVTTPAFVYAVQLTSLSISAVNFKWWTAFNNDITVPFNISGNVSKSLYVNISGTDYSEGYEVALGTGVYVETAYNYSIPHPQKSGIFKISAYVSNADGSIRTKTLSFNVICAVAGEQAKLIAINNVAERITNWSENILFDYTMYDGDNVSTSALFEITKGNEVVFSSTEESISTSTKYSFSLPLEIDTIDNQDFSIIANVKDSGVLLTDPLEFPVNNSLGYSAVAGAVMYINPKTRTNRQGNRECMINEVDGTQIEAIWNGINWGNDGWTNDNLGYKTLRLLAGSSVDINYSPFGKESARTGKTFEIDYQISNVTDFSKPVITVSTPAGDLFVGLNIYPDNVIMYSQSLKDKDVQSLHTFEEKRTRLTLTIMPDAYGNSGFNLCILYISGIKNREFTYENNDYFAHNGTIVIGSDNADVDVYGIREYDSALTSQGVQTNYVNWLSTAEEKNSFKTENDILDTNGSEIDFDNTVDQYNVIVFDNTIPSMADQTQRIGTLDVYFYDHPEWNVSISDVTAKGQGTSSMKYWIWNTRYQLDKNLSVITHADGSTSKKVWQMVPWIPAGQKFTAKKNFASSMQSHKIGAVNSYTDLYKQVGLSNEAMQREGYSDVRVSVYELPFFCFEKSINDDGEPVYVFKGLYTFGPDKGDKYTFGYDTDYFPDLLSIEGSDNSPLLTLFRVPWNTDSGRVVYDEDKEAWQYNGANSFGFGAGDIANIVNWIPTYNHVYQCSPRLLPFDGTPDELNDDLDIYRTQPYEFWIAKVGDSHRFDVYYYEASVGLFIPSDIGEGPINLVSQLVDKDYGLASADIENKTNDSLNTLFINARVAKFRKEAALYWDIDDCLYFMNNVEFNAGTDERAKNTYPYSFGIETSKWRWRVDDADTRFDTTNRGLPDKEYSVETHDLDETGAAVWNGETNNFFNLMELAFPEEKIISMRKSMAAMQSLGGLKSGNDLEKIYAFYKKYFFDQAQEYFPSDGYNADAKYCYENGKLAYNAGIYSNDTDPITQSLGDHYLAEQRWITKRILYMMSKYNFGLFSASGTDTITVRAAGNTIKYQLTPAMDMYPAIANGTSIIQGKRTKAGEVCEMEIELSGSGDQQNAIQGASYLQDIGDWYNKNVTGSMIIQGRMLRDIRLGSKNNPVIISISSLTLSNCVSLQRLLLSNITTLSGTLNLTACEHLQEIYADGTSLAQIVLPSGGGLRVVEYSRFNQYLSLSNYPLLTDDGIGIDLCKTVISDFFIVDCALVRPMKILVDIMNAQMEQGDNHALKRIRAVGFEESYNNSFILDKLVDLTNGTYSGLSSEGLSGEDELPVLDGTLNINASVYGDTVEALRAMFTRLTLNINGEFYVRFADDIVTMLCAENWGDGIGTSKRQMGNITELGIIFAGTGINSFKELSLSKIESLTNEFTGCSQLSSIAFPETLRILNTTAFAGSMVALDLSDCTHITDLLIDSDDTIDFMPSANDNLVNITYNNGSSCIHMVGYSNAILTINNESEIVDFWVENCNTNNNILSKIQSIYSVKEHLLKYIRAVGFDEEFYTNEILKTLLSLAENGYRGINESGERDDNIIPVLSGKVLCTDKYSPDMLYDLKSYFPNILFNMTGEACVDFKDQVVKDICVRNWGSDGELTVEQAAGITTINTKFKENLEITSFNELKYFTNANARTEYPGEPGVPYGAFDRCTNLESVTIMPTAKRIETSAFGGCSSLKKVLFPDSVYFLGTNIFYGCTSLESVNIPKGFADSKFPSNVFRDCISLTSLIEVPETVTIIGMATFNGCTSLAGVKLKGNVPPSLEYSVFGNSTFPIYVPEAAVNAYKSASGWTSLASRIMGY